jgi:hypothetical protein
MDLNNGLWIFNPNKNIMSLLSIDNLSSSTNDRMLYDRGKYLTEFIDKSSDTSKEDISDLPSGNNVIVWGPGYGKTTAIRQFIVDNPSNQGIYAAKRKDDVAYMSYDICAQYYYINSIKIPLGYIRRLTSDPIDRSIDRNKLIRAHWIIATHEQLLIEPPSLIFTVSPNIALMSTKDGFIRKYLFIDEFPSSVYKSINYQSMVNLELLEYRSGAHLSTSSEDKTKKRIMYIDQLYDDLFKESTEDSKLPEIVRPSGLLNLLPTPSSSLIRIRNESDDEKSQLKLDRIKFFSNLYLTKYNDLKSNPNNVPKFLYYSVTDLPIPNKYILDGTGDILTHNSKYWTHLLNNKFIRTIYFESIELIQSSSERSSKSDQVISEYCTIIQEVLKRNPNRDILVYLWKSTYDQDNLINCIESNFSRNELSRLNFISYKSGKETTTSEYKSSSVAIILGKFNIPNSEIARLNQINQSELTSDNYTIAYMIQFLYRTCARDMSPSNKLKLYFDVGAYSKDTLDQLLNYLNIDTRSISIGNEPEISCTINSNNPTDSSILSKMISSSIGSIIIEENFYKYKVLTSKQISDILGIKSDHISRYLNNHHIDYKYVKGKGRSQSQYKIHI